MFFLHSDFQRVPYLKCQDPLFWIKLKFWKVYDSNLQELWLQDDPWRYLTGVARVTSKYYILANAPILK